MFKRLTFFSLPLILYLTIEILNRGSILSIFKVLFRVNSLILNYILLLSLLSIFFAIFNRIKLAYWLTGIPFIILAFVSGVKQKIVGMPLMPWDFSLADEAGELTNYLGQLLNIKAILIISVWIAGSIYVFKNYTISLNLAKRSLLLGTAVATLFVIYTDIPFNIKNLLNIEHSSTTPSTNHWKNGFILASSMNLRQAFITKPENYSESSIKKIVSNIKKENNNIVPTNKNPNVIVILSESLWDPTQLPNVKFSEDPLPFIHKLQKEYTTGNMISPQFGGWTANVEFEILTANSTRFLPPGAIAYNQYISNKGVPSIASTLRNEGYKTSFFTAYHNWYYNVDKVYKNLGFSNLISFEFMKDHNKGPYLADEEVARIVSEEFTKIKGPKLFCINTMENHGAYTKDKFKHNPISVESNKLSRESKEIVQSYATGAQDADRMLKTLADHFAKIGEPTLLVMYGDHLPSLGDDYKVYKESGYLKPGDKHMEKLHKVPLVIWDNFLAQNQRKPLQDMNTFYLTPFILDLINKPGTSMMSFLSNQLKDNPVLPLPAFYNEYNFNVEKQKDYELLQYDSLFGNRYSLKEANRIIDPLFKMGNYDKFEITNLNATSNKITISGTFAPLTKVFIDDKECQSQLINNTLTIDKSSLQNRSSIQLKLLDSKNKILIESKKYDIKKLLH